MKKLWFKDIFKRDLKIFWPDLSERFGEEDMANSFMGYLDERIKQRVKTGNAIIRENKDNDILEFISAIVEYVMYTMDVSNQGKELLKEEE